MSFIPNFMRPKGQAQRSDENSGDWLVPADTSWSQILDYVSGTGDNTAFDFYSLGLAGEVNRNTAISYTTLNRCVTLISGVAAQLITNGGFRVEDQDGRKVKTARARRAVELFISSPDGEVPAYNWIEDAMSDLLLDGNLIAVIDRGARNYPVALRRMLSWDASIQRGLKSGKRMYRVRLADGSGRQPTEHHIDDNVFHARWPRLRRTGRSDRDGFALSPVVAMRPALEIGIRADNYIRSFFHKDKGGIKGKLAIGLERSIKDDQRQQLAEYLKKYMSSQMPLILGGNPKFTVLKTTPQDADSAKLREFQVREVARMYGVPAPLLGENVTQWGQGIEQLSKLFWRFGCRPHIDRFLHAAAMRLLEPGQVFQVDAIDLLRGDTEAISGMIMATMGDSQRPAIATVEEARRWVGLPSDGAPKQKMMMTPTEPDEPMTPTEPGNGA